MERYAFGALFGLFVALTAKDLLFEGSSAAEEGTPATGRLKEIPPSNLRNIMSGPTLRFFYCYS
jgi:hypothetical protein